jgi:hypothetical protein
MIKKTDNDKYLYKTIKCKIGNAIDYSLGKVVVFIAGIS